MTTLTTLTVLDANATAHSIGYQAGLYATAEQFMSNGKETLNDLLRDLKESGAVIDGDARTNPVRKAIKDGLVQAKLEARRADNVLSMLTLYYQTGAMVTTLSTTKDVKASIALQEQLKTKGETFTPNVKVEKSQEQKDKEKKERIEKRATAQADAYKTKLLSDSIDVTVKALTEHEDFYLVVAYIAEHSTIDGFCENMEQHRIKRAESLAKLKIEQDRIMAEIKRLEA